MPNCKPILTVQINGVEITLEGSKISETASFDEICKNIAELNGLLIKDWINLDIGPVNITTPVDLKNVSGNTSFTEIHLNLNWLTRNYNPIVNNIKSLMEKIYSFGEPKILQVNGSLKLNGAEVPSVNLLPNSIQDLIVLKSNNPTEIYRILTEYFYEKTITEDENKLKKLKGYIESKVKRAKRLSLEFKDFKIDDKDLVKAVLYDKTLDKILQIVPPDFSNFNTSREELFAVLKSLTKEYTGKEIRIPAKYLDYDPTSDDLEEHVVEVKLEAEDIWHDRTVENARWADVTLAIAHDFGTCGEILTTNSAGKRYVKYHLTSLDNIDLYVESAVESLYDLLKNKGFTQNIKLNIAGNGIYTLKIPQIKVDEFVTKVINGLMQKGITIAEVRSGGQSGVDEAGIKAAINLGLPWSIGAPEGFVFKNIAGGNVYGIKNFMSRFDPDYYTKEKEYIIPLGENEFKTITSTIGEAKYKIAQILLEGKEKYQEELGIAKQQPRYISTHTMNEFYINEGQNIDDSNEAIKKYNQNHSGREKIRSTMDAILKGFRTSTTRMEHWEGFKSNSGYIGWDKHKEGDIILFIQKNKKNPNNERTVIVKITLIKTWTQDDLTKEKIKEWSDAEGWSVEKFEKDIAPAIKDGKVVKLFFYEIVDIRYNEESKETKKLAYDLAEKIRKGEIPADYLPGTIVEFMNGRCE